MSLKLIHSRSKRWAKGDEILVYLCHSDSLVCCLLWYTLASDLIPSVKTSQKIHWRNFEALLWSTLVWYLQQEIMNQCIGLYLYMCVSIYLFVYTEDPSYLKGLSNFHSDHTLKHFSDIMKALKIFFCLTHLAILDLKSQKSALHNYSLKFHSNKNFHSDFSQRHLFTAQWCAFLTKLCAFVSITFLWTLSGISPPECSHGCPVSPTPAWSDAYKMWTGQKPLWGTWPMIHLMASWFCKNIHYLTSGMFRLSLCFWACSFFFCIVAYGGWIIIGPDGTQILQLPSNLWTIWIRTG